MCISAQTCDRHLALLFTKLKDHPLPSVRANLMVALGDLAFRFPNLIEPWTEHLYARLKDDHTQVRGQTLLVLTHLILNDMIKVSGCVGPEATSERKQTWARPGSGSLSARRQHLNGNRRGRGLGQARCQPGGNI